MLIRTRPIQPAVVPARDRDPGRDGLRCAIRAAVTVPVAIVVSYRVVGGTTAPLFSYLGAYWLMVLTDFPGNRQSRALAYLGLGAIGCVLITLGTLARPVPWLAVSLMFILGVAATLAGASSATMAAGQHASVMLYLCPVLTPVGSLGERLLGWLIALAICVPSSLFFLPPRHHSQLRRHVALVCAALADRIAGVCSAADVTRAMDALRSDFLAANARPVGLGAGGRALVRIVDHLQLLGDRVDDHTASALGLVTQPIIEVLRCCVHVLDQSHTAHRAALDQALAQLQSLAHSRDHDDVTLMLAEPDDTAAVGIAQELLTRRMLATTVGLVGRVIAAAAAADARPVWARTLGLRLPRTGFADRLLPETVAAAAIPVGLLARRSVAARNGLRKGIGLALAVALTYLVSIQHELWLVLGMITVLGSSALITGTKMVQTVVGTAAGVIVGGVTITAIGSRPVLLILLLLPMAVFGAVYLSRVFSFAAGEAMVTLAGLALLNVEGPIGWWTGLLRVGNIALGTGMATVVSLLLWPRGATAAVSTVIDTALGVNLRYLRSAVFGVTRGRSETRAGSPQALSREALLLSVAVDDAIRQYLSETRSGADMRSAMVSEANRATWIRVVADTVAAVGPLPQPDAYPSAREVLEVYTELVCERLSGSGAPTWQPITGDFVRALRAEATDAGAVVDDALPLAATAASLAELEVVSAPLQDTADASDPLPAT